MAEADLTFLGEQIKRMQSDLRHVRAEQLRLEADVMERLDTFERSVDARFDAVDARLNSIDARFNSIDARFDAVDARFNSIDARFEQVHRTMAVNLDVLLAAIKGREE